MEMLSDLLVLSFVAEACDVRDALALGDGRLAVDAVYVKVSVEDPRAQLVVPVIVRRVCVLLLVVTSDSEALMLRDTVPDALRLSVRNVAVEAVCVSVGDEVPRVRLCVSDIVWLVCDWLLVREALPVSVALSDGILTVVAVTDACDSDLLELSVGDGTTETVCVAAPRVGDAVTDIVRLVCDSVARVPVSVRDSVPDDVSLC